MTIDNFDLFRSHLEFKKAVKNGGKKDDKEIADTYDRYIIQILRRAKDVSGREYGVNTDNRLIKTYEVSSLEYYDKKKDTIIDLCKLNHARAYILPQVRSVHDCLVELLKLGLGSLDNPTIKFQHILRSALCRMHKSRDKKWIIDLDKDEMFGVTQDEVFNYVKSALKEVGKEESDAFIVPTKNGCHIVLRPIDSMKINKRFPLAFKGVRKGYRYETVLQWLDDNATQNDVFDPMYTERTYILTALEELKTNPFNVAKVEEIIKTAVTGSGKYLDTKQVTKLIESLRAKCKVDITGWMHHDDMSLLYYSDED